MPHFNSHKRGFLLVETLVSLTLFAFAAGAIGTIAGLTFQGHRTTSGNAVATKIAQEGMELVINKRENHVQCVRSSSCTTINNWDQNMKDSPVQPDATLTDQLKPSNQFDLHSSDHTLCRVESSTDNGKFAICSNVTGTKKEIDGGYNRKVSISNVPGPDRQLIVEVTVSWSEEGEDRSYTLERVIYGPKK